ncbi:MAG: histidine--tRNA ligase [Planctomycetes bacterium]|nr:histidine--tRNA ligase [Planctomycetota bacterium]
MERRQFRAPRGIRDVLPEEIPAWRLLEDTARRLALLRGYREIRPALLEEVELFTRSVGEVTDIVQKEMFTLQKGDSVLALRPEGTAGIVRAYLEAGYAQAAPLQRLFHIGPMFRYERPQKGRERMFTQFDVEVVGSLDPRLDAEIIHLAASFFEALGLTGLEVRVNSMGDGDDRARWREALREFLRPTIAEHCELCRERFERNVLRVLDCKNPRCKELNAGAPTILGFLSEANRAHFESVQKLLVGLARTVVVDAGIVRGLDYYTRTVFEIHAPALGARSALCGGGRYDHLVHELGGPELGAVGFAVGFTGTLLVLRELGLLGAVRERSVEVFVASAGEGLDEEVFRLAEELRAAGLSTVYDVEARSLKAQMKLAGKAEHAFAVVLGGDELQRGTVQLKDLAKGEQRELARAELVATLRATQA